MISFLLQAAAPVENPELSGGAIAFMLISIGAVTALTVWCFARVLGGRKDL